MTNIDFPATALTNFRVVDSFSTVFWRFYIPLSYCSNAPMRNASDLNDTLCTLRNVDVLAACAQDIFAIWAFCHNGEFAAISPFVEESAQKHGPFTIAGRQYIALASGNLSLSELMSMISTAPTSALKCQSLHALDGHDHDATVDLSAEHLTYAGFHEALLTAFRAALLLRLSEGQQYIPLGAQTLFSSIGLEENSLYPDKPLRVNPFLAKLSIQFTSAGKIILACHNAPQPGIEQLHHDESDCLMAVEPDEDIWLAPLGIKGKFVARYKSSSLFPNRNEYPEVWKSTVEQWLTKFRLQLSRQEQNFWIEVDVEADDIPFFDSTIVAEADQGSLRILWPARYSFHRAKCTEHDFSEELEYFIEGAEGPLDFAARWVSEMSLSEDTSRNADDIKVFKRAHETQTQNQHTPTIDDDEGDFELPQSLGVPIPFADLFSDAGSVYPTPSDAQPISASGVSVSETTHTIPAIPGTVDTTAGDNGEHISNGSLPGNDLWSLPAFPSALQDADIGPFFSDMVTGEDDPFSTFSAAPFEFRGLLDSDFLQNDQCPPSDDLFANTIPDCDSNFDFTTHGPPMFSLDPAELPTVPTTEVFGQAEDNPISAMKSFEPTRCDQPAGVLPAESSGLHNATDFVTEAMPEASLSHIHPRSPSKSPPPLTPHRIGRFLSESIPRFDSIRAISGLTICKANAETAGRSMLPSDRKYNVDGRFYFDVPQSERERVNGQNPIPSDIPRLGFPGERSRNAQSVSDVNGSPDDASNLEEQYSSDESTESSEELIGDEGFDQDAKSRKRKWSPPSRSDEDAGTGPHSSLPDAFEAEAAGIKFNDVIGSLLSSTELRSFHGAFTMPRTTAPALPETDDESELAQLVVDVMTQSCFCHVQRLYTELADRRGNGMISSRIFHPLSSDVQSHVPALRELICLDDTSDPSERPKSIAASLTLIPQPYVKIRKGGKRMDALASITSFWDTFELEPFYGPKDVQAACIYPGIATDEAHEFLSMISQLYEGQRFGKHKTVELVPWTSGTSQNTPTYKNAIGSLFQICTQLGPRLHGEDGAIVIYILNPFPSVGAIYDICSCFLHLRKKYCSSGGSTTPQRVADDISLQIVPLDFVFDPLSLVVPSRDVLRQLAIEVHTRCQPQAKTDFPRSSPMYLSTRAPTPVAIRLTRQVTSPLINTQSLVHLAYSKSFDSRWLTAAWTDHQGRNQATLSFCLRKEEEAVSIPLRDIRRHIWMISVDIVQTARLTSRMIIAKDAPYEEEELADWVAIIDTFNKQNPRKVDVSFVAVDIYPGLNLENPPTQKESSNCDPSKTNWDAASLSQSTPGPHGDRINPSQKPFGSSNTPSGGSSNTPNVTTESPCLKAYDKLDQAWAVILSHTPSVFPNSSETRNQRWTGYLVYPDNLNGNEGHAALAVQVVQYPLRRPGDLFLLKILQSYRQLATLSKVRGLSLARSGHPLPWHIATAVRGQQILSQAL